MGPALIYFYQFAFDFFFFVKYIFTRNYRINSVFDIFLDDFVFQKRSVTSILAQKYFVKLKFKCGFFKTRIFFIFSNDIYRFLKLFLLLFEILVEGCKEFYVAMQNFFNGVNVAYRQKRNLHRIIKFNFPIRCLNYFLCYLISFFFSCVWSIGRITILTIKGYPNNPRDNRIF